MNERRETRRQRRIRTYVRAEIMRYRDELDGKRPADMKAAEREIERRLRSRYTGAFNEVDWRFVLQVIAKLLPLILLFLEDFEEG